MKKNYLIYVCWLILAITTTTGCKKFLDVRPDTNNQIVPRFVEDFEEMLNNASLAQPNFLMGDLISDDVMINDDQIKAAGTNSFYINGYLWAQTVWAPSDKDDIYYTTYVNILQMNIVLNNIDGAKGGTAERKAVVRAQAKINRAYYYFQLANLYGRAYNSATAATDLAVPIVTEPDATKQSSRATVQQVYDLVLADLQDAVNVAELPDFGVDIIHPGRAAALAMQARVYLTMSNYNQALQVANAALNIRSTLLDYNTFSFTNPDDPTAGINKKPLALIDQVQNPEILFAKVCIDGGFLKVFNDTFFISEDLKALLGLKDLRYLYNFYVPKGGSNANYFTYNTSNMQFNYSIGVPEMMLIKAECLARSGDGPGSLVLLNKLRQNRFKPADYKELKSTDAMEILELTLEERRRELFLHGGMRIFDLKRLNQDKALQRFSTKTNEVIATLPAGSPRYLLPIAPIIIANNPLILPNVR